MYFFIDITSNLHPTMYTQKNVSEHYWTPHTNSVSHTRVFVSIVGQMRKKGVVLLAFFYIPFSTDKRYYSISVCDDNDGKLESCSYTFAFHEFFIKYWPYTSFKSIWTPFVWYGLFLSFLAVSFILMGQFLKMNTHDMNLKTLCAWKSTKKFYLNEVHFYVCSQNSLLDNKSNFQRFYYLNVAIQELAIFGLIFHRLCLNSSKIIVKKRSDLKVCTQVDIKGVISLYFSLTHWMWSLPTQNQPILWLVIKAIIARFISKIIWCCLVSFNEGKIEMTWLLDKRVC